MHRISPDQWQLPHSGAFCAMGDFNRHRLKIVLNETLKFSQKDKKNAIHTPGRRNGAPVVMKVITFFSLKYLYKILTRGLNG